MRFSVNIPVPSRLGDREVALRVASGEALTAVSVAVAVVFAFLFPDLGSSADLSYYGTLAQVIPVFLVAAALESRTRLTSAIERTATTLLSHAAELRDLKTMLRDVDLTPAGRKEIDAHIGSIDGVLRKYNGEFASATQFARRLLRSYVLLAVPGEVAAIGALAAGHGGAFVFALSALSVITIGILWTKSLLRTGDLEIDLEADDEDEGRNRLDAAATP